MLRVDKNNDSTESYIDKPVRRFRRRFKPSITGHTSVESFLVDNYIPCMNDVRPTAYLRSESGLTTPIMFRFPPLSPIVS